jgi:hypothetical protein
MYSRTIKSIYQDPVDLIWLNCAYCLGWQVDMSDEVYASWDGKTTLFIASPKDRDADDCVAQLIFHEICHALVAGEKGRQQVDWGLSNFDDRDVLDELACHRLQASLAQSFGLRSFMAVTTQWRPYYDALPVYPIRDAYYQEDVLLNADLPLLTHIQIEYIMNKVTSAHRNYQKEPWLNSLQTALKHTQQIKNLLHTLESTYHQKSLWLQE